MKGLRSFRVKVGRRCRSLVFAFFLFLDFSVIDVLALAMRFYKAAENGDGAGELQRGQQQTVVLINDGPTSECGGHARAYRGAECEHLCACVQGRHRGCCAVHTKGARTRADRGSDCKTSLCLRSRRTSWLLSESASSLSAKIAVSKRDCTAFEYHLGENDYRLDVMQFFFELI